MENDISMSEEAKHRLRKRRVLKLSAFLFVLDLILVGFTYVVLINNNQRNAKKTGEVMLNQMCSILEKNKSTEDSLMDSLKEEYTIRAKTVAYMLDHHPDAENSVVELNKIAKLMSLDEIHIYDENGTIYSGTLKGYYGKSFDSDEEMSYFKPMLQDKSLSMCRDVESGLSDKDSMMYAITWNSTGEKMVQVGIKPVRMLKEFESNKVSNVVASMPVYDNLNIYVADIETKAVLGTTDEKVKDALEDLEMYLYGMSDDTVINFVAPVDGEVCYCTAIKKDGDLICITQGKAENVRSTLLSVLIVFTYLLMASVVLLFIMNRMYIIKGKQAEQFSILTTMSDIYYSMHLIDLSNKTFVEYSSQNHIRDVVTRHSGEDAVAIMKNIINETMTEDYIEKGQKFSDLTTLAKRMQDKKIIFKDLLSKEVGWIRMSFITINTDMEGFPQKVICTTQIIDEEKRKEEYLIRESNTDKLTQCYNRRAYEEDVDIYQNHSMEKEFTFISMDVNGLKAINDSLGHEAGDELLKAAALCMTKCFGKYGKVYRIGGDEFVAIIVVGDDVLKQIKKEFEHNVDEWSGNLIDRISVSCGYVTRNEFPDATFKEIARIADTRMYEEKARHYKILGSVPR